MRHRIKKIPSLISKYKSLHHRLLHSDKSTYDTYGNNTYFYKIKYFLKQHFPYSKPKTIPLAVPAMSVFALLLVLGLMAFPAGGRAVMALDGDTTGEEDDGLNLSLEITSPTVEGTIGTNKDGSVSAVVGEPSYGGVKLTTTATGINPHTGYSIYIQSTDKDLSLVNDIDSSYRINPISDSTNLAKGEIPENEWGYAIEQEDTASYASMSYKPIAASGDVSIPAIHGTNELNNTPFILAFGANIGKDKLAGHYRTNVLVSLVAEAKSVVTYNLIYNGNGNTGGTVPTVEPVSTRAESYKFTIAENTGNLVKAGSTFAGWAENAGATTVSYAPGSEITLAPTGTETEVTKTLYAVWNTNYSLIYNNNGGTGGPGTVTVPNNGTSHTFTVPATAPTRDKYEFLGWADSSDATVAQYTSGSNITLQPNSPSKTVYAVWKSKMNLSTITTMQQMTTAICDASDIGDTKKLTDTRDTQSYQVTKLKDGRCWMTQNMNNASGSISYTQVGSSESSSGPYQPAYGKYYPLNTAKSTVCNGMGGWTLPSSDQYKQLLDGITTSSTLTAPPYNFVYSGEIMQQSATIYTLFDAGSSGGYWTSADSGVVFEFTNSNRIKTDKSVAASILYFSVRCVAR